MAYKQIAAKTAYISAGLIAGWSTLAYLYRICERQVVVRLAESFTRQESTDDAPNT